MSSIKQISTVTLIGSGNVATALGLSLFDNGVTITEVFSQNINNAKALAQKVNSSYINNIKDINTTSDLYIIATPDKDIKNIIGKLINISGIIVHTSGSESINILNSTDYSYGVFYPLQTFTVGSLVDFTDIPICIEGSDKATNNSLIQLAHKISSKVLTLNSEQRQYLHLTAVTVNNFTNLLYSIAKELLDKKEIDFSLLLPLIKETANKLNEVNPAEAQTGPAKRNDKQTISKHLELLHNYPEFKEIYKLMSDQITKKYHGKL